MIRAGTSLAEVAYAVGYCDQTHLNRRFKKNCGRDPQSVRPADATMSPVAAPLPIDDVLGALRSTFAAHSGALLVAPPGAGATTPRR
jgi:AraC-like DNA-binding protein